MENIENFLENESEVLVELRDEDLYVFIKDGEIQYFGPLDEYNLNFEGLKIKKSEINFNKYNDGYSIFEENGEIIYKKTERYTKVQNEKQEFLRNQEKEEKINKFRTWKEKAEKLRLEYLTAELLPQGPNRTVILEKLEENKDIIAQKMDSMITEFRDEFGENILELLI